MLTALEEIKMKITGGCHCGKITYEAEINLDNVVVFHFTDCQNLSGSAFRSVAMSEKGSFKFLAGDPKIYVKTGDSGNKRVQAFCADCGSSIYSSFVGEEPKQYAIRLGTVDQRNLITPTKQKWFRSAQSWTQDMSSLPAIEKK